MVRISHRRCGDCETQFTVRVRVVEWVRVPVEPVTVTV
jgi:hypothetical protein